MGVFDSCYYHDILGLITVRVHGVHNGAARGKHWQPIF
jgi:hypothetical protein